MYNLLLAEDEPAILDAMMKVIDWEKLGFNKPIACIDGAKAIDALKNGFVPNAIITDICMPFTNGLELSEYVTQNYSNIPIVILTGFDEFEYAHKAIKLKIYDYILKPVTPKALTDIVFNLKTELDSRIINDEFETDEIFVFEAFLTNIKSALENKDGDEAKKLCDRLVKRFKNTNLEKDVYISLGNRFKTMILDFICDSLGREKKRELESEFSNSDFTVTKDLDEMEDTLNCIRERAFKMLDEAGKASSFISISEIIAYIDDNYADEQLNLSKICKDFLISISYFSAIFKEKTGTTFIKYLTELRIEKAKQAILYTNKRNSEIAQSVGFSDPHYFSLTFKKITGKSPSEFREDIQGEDNA